MSTIILTVECKKHEEEDTFLMLSWVAPWQSYIIEAGDISVSY